MNPILFKIYDQPIYTYGFSVMCAVFLLYFFVQLRAPKAGLKRTVYSIIFLPTFLGMLLGGKILYVLLFQYSQNPILNLSSNRGFTVNGGLIVAILVIMICLRLLKEPFFPYLDHIARYGGLSYFTQRFFGCFYGYGCCFGKIINHTSLLTVPYLRNNPDGIIPPAIIYADRLTGIENTVVWVYPTQIFHAVLGLIMYLIPNLYKPKNILPGERSLLVLATFAFGRFFIEFSTCDSGRKTIFEGRLLADQLFFLIMAGIMASILIVIRIRAIKKNL